MKDWSNKGNGQRHVNWCRRPECGEEEVDWEVVPIINKGLGIRAKKLLPAGLKIVVEPILIHQMITQVVPSVNILNILQILLIYLLLFITELEITN